MTPDEVVNLLKELTEIREKECGNIPPYRTSKEAIALSSAITIIQDYQKLRERVKEWNCDNPNCGNGAICNFCALRKDLENVVKQS